MKFRMNHGRTWSRPDIAYANYQEQAKKLPPDEAEWDGKYKRLREERDLAIFGMALYEMQSTPFFVQMNDLDDSPDAFVMRQSLDEELTFEIAPVELTFYGRSRIGLPESSLADKLNEPAGKFTKLPAGYWLVIHIGKGLSVDHEEVAARLKEIEARFQVVSLQEIADSPDTVARVVVYNPECLYRDVNIGAVAAQLQVSDILGEVTQVRGKRPAS